MRCLQERELIKDRVRDSSLPLAFSADLDSLLQVFSRITDSSLPLLRLRPLP